MRNKSTSTKLAMALGAITTVVGAAAVFSVLSAVQVSADPASETDTSASQASSVAMPSSAAAILSTRTPIASVPQEIPAADSDGIIYLTGSDGNKHATTIDPALQAHLSTFIADNTTPVAAIVVLDPKTGSILAMSQGHKSDTWGGKAHTALHAGFPAASLFKTIVTTAAFEIADLDSDEQIALLGGCAHVRETGDWLGETARDARSRISLRRAFGASCNGFFAKLAVNNLGIGMITQFAKRYGWESGVPADFHMERSPFFPPSPQNSSTHTIGRFAAGFGYVGLSAVHAAYIMSTIANQGLTMPVRLFRETPIPDAHALPRIFTEQTALRLKQVMDATTHGGTATVAFGRGKYRKLRDLVGGKTGTLTGNAPRGVTSWFAGIAPLDNPEVVVASVVVLEDHWRIKGPNLAAEGFWAFFDERSHHKVMSNTTVLDPVAAKEIAQPAATEPAVVR